MHTPERASHVPESVLPAPVSWTRVQQISLIRREVRECIPDGNLSALFDAAEHLVEGTVERDGKAFASVMTTVDLAQSEALFRERPDEATAARVSTLMEDDPRIRARMMALGRAAFAREGDGRARHCRGEIDVQLRVDGSRIFIDADLVLLLDQPERRRRGAR